MLTQALESAPTRHATRLLLGEFYAISGRTSEAAELWNSIELIDGQIEGRLWWYQQRADPKGSRRHPAGLSSFTSAEIIGNMKDMQNWWLIALSIFAGVMGQVTIKLGVTNPPSFTIPGTSLLPSILHSPLTILGLALYGVGAISWIAVLKRLDLSFAYPFLALNFVLDCACLWDISG